jgi:hypothetical protein
MPSPGTLLAIAFAIGICGATGHVAFRNRSLLPIPMRVFRAFMEFARKFSRPPQLERLFPLPKEFTPVDIWLGCFFLYFFLILVVGIVSYSVFE